LQPSPFVLATQRVAEQVTAGQPATHYHYYVLRGWFNTLIHFFSFSMLCSEASNRNILRCLLPFSSISSSFPQLPQPLFNEAQSPRPSFSSAYSSLSPRVEFCELGFEFDWGLT